MLFDSVPFIFLIALTLPAGWFLRGMWRQSALLISSNIFYGWWDWRFLGLLWISIFVDYFAAMAIERDHAKGEKGKKWLLGSLIVQLGILGYFKYAGFFLDSLADATAALGIPYQALRLDIVLPVGISFYTFQTMSYTIDVYRREMPAEKNLISFALFVTWMPQLVAGPIERATALLHQIKREPIWNAKQIGDGVALILWGLFQKMVVADRAALIANSIFNDTANAPNRSAIEWYVATCAFAIQIFADFSGYSDIARGTSRLFGVELMLNFKHPYFAIGPQDFWRRWHISLSTWLRDYLYIPLGGNRRGPIRTKVNLFMTMLLGGLWHGAAWHFVLWGAYHGALLMIERALGIDVKEPRTVIGRALRILVMFQFTLFGWLLFRVETMKQLGMIVTSGKNMPVAPVGTTAATLVLLFMPVLLVWWHQTRRGSMEVFENSPQFARAAFALAAIACFFLYRVQSRIEFIYFQF